MKFFFLLLICTLLYFARSQGERYFPDKLHQNFYITRELIEQTIKNNSLITTLTLKGNTWLGYYYVTLFFGIPLQRQTLIVDTGSSLTAIPCSDCGLNCGLSHFNPFFNETNSSTFQDFECNETFDQYICSNCLDQCPFSLAYMEGSSYHGHYKKDLLFFGDEFEDFYNATNQTLIDGELFETRKVFVPFGCVNQETKYFYSQNADGILGLGVLTNTIDKPPNFLDVLEINNENSSKAFTLCLAQEGGYFSVGGYNFTTHEPNENISYTTYNDITFSQYQLTLNKIKVDGQDLDLHMDLLNRGGVILDSGTTFSYFPSPVYDAILSSLADFCNKNTSNCGDMMGITEEALGICWTYEPTISDSKEHFFSTFPTFSFYFGPAGDAEYQWKAQDYLYRIPGDDEVYCLGMASNDYTTLGATFMKNHDIMFDKDNSRIGFIRANCSQIQDV
jgi:hypothetical protein